LLIGGASFDAEEALAKGLIGKVLPRRRLPGCGVEAGRQDRRGAPLTLKQVKHAIAQIVRDPEQRELDKSEQLFQACYASADYREGIRAFAEKRRPVFKAFDGCAVGHPGSRPEPRARRTAGRAASGRSRRRGDQDRAAGQQETRRAATARRS
jgi:hypothetical protein